MDDQDQLTRTLDAIAQVAQRIPVVFPAHPRTAQNIEAARKRLGLRAVKTWGGGEIAEPGLWMMPAASYLDFLDLIQHAVLVMTDSGGVQEETTFLGVPCLTYRDNTERPVTVSLGTNRAGRMRPSPPTGRCFRGPRERRSKTDPRSCAPHCGTGRLLHELCIS